MGLGGVVGSLANGFFPDIVTQPGGYVLVGMAAFFAGVANAPIGPMIMVCELTQGYGLLAPLMLACVLCIIPNLTRGLKPYGVIENVVTHADHRRQGYGRLVLEHALQHAWSQNCYKVMLLTGRKSEAVFGFYESVGFDRHAKQAFLAKPQ